MKNFLKNLRNRIVDGWRESDTKSKLKWGCVVTAAVLGLCSNLLDTRIKDEMYERNLKEAIADKVSEANMGDQTNEG